MASVPAKFIKFKEIDFDSEIFLSLGLGEKIGNKDFAPPSLGVFSLLETMDSNFVKDLSKSDFMDFCRVAYVMYFRKNAAYKVREWVRNNGKTAVVSEDPETWLDFDRQAAEFAVESKFQAEDVYKLFSLLMNCTFNGYEMIPNSGESQYMPYLFGSQTIAGALSVAGKYGISMDSIMWDFPLVLLGHLYAVMANANGVKGVSRPKDPDDIKKQIAEANEREKRGELHPWQIAEPEYYGVTKTQLEANPALKEQHKAMIDNRKKELSKK